MVGLLIEVHRLAPSPGWRSVLEIAVLLFSYGLMAIWLGRNSAALIEDKADHAYTNIIIVEALPLSALPSPASVYEEAKSPTLAAQSSDNDYRGTAPARETIAVEL
jgi:hypothetical protein